MTAISISKYIYNILINDEIIKGIVAEKVYPLVAEEETTFPFIIYRKNNITTEYTKDGRAFDNADITITIIATDYTTTVQVVERVRELFENNNDFKQVRMVSNSDDYNDNAYIQEITFSIKIKN